MLRVLALVAFISGVAQAGDDEKAAFGPTLVLVDDSTVSARSLTIASDRVQGDGVPADLTLDDLQRITMPDVDEFSQPISIAHIFLRGNSDLWVGAITIADDKARIEWWGGQPLVVPVDLLRAVRIDLATESPEFEKSLATPSTEQDRLFVKGDDGQISAVSGLIDSLDAEQWKLEVAGQIRAVPRSKIYGVVFAKPAATSRQPRCIVTFRDHSQLSGDNLTLAGDKTTLLLGPDATAQFSWSNVNSVAIRSSRLVYLSDWPSIKEEQTPIVTLPFPAQRDKSVTGSRLKVGPQFFDKGLGVHSRSTIAFALDGKWDLFVAKIGLDEEAGGKGDCIFDVLADGKSIFQRRMSGHDLVAAEIKLPITGCQQLTLIVEPGVGLDLADHADWCDARLIKNKPSAGQ